MKTIAELIEERVALSTELKSFWDGALASAKKESRSPSKEDIDRFDTMNEDVDGLADQIKDLEEVDARSTKLDEINKSLDQTTGRKARSGAIDNKVDDAREAKPAEDREKRPFAAPEYRDAFQRYMDSGDKSAFQVECRALQVDSSVDGGYLVAPEEFINKLIKFVDDEVHIRQLASKFTIAKAQSLGAPSLDTDISDSDWTSEITTGTEDSTMKFGKRNLHPHPLAKLIKMSETLLRESLMPAETIVMQALGRKFSYTQEQAFMTGSGAMQPLGVFTASADGISTGRDVSTGNTTTAIGADNLINVKFNLKSQHAAKARWIFHRDAVRDIRKLKDGEGNYLWVQGISSGQPDTIIEVPYIMSEFAPNTFTTGLYVGIIGNWEHYWIVDALSMTIKRLNELYAETNQVGFIGRLETDGMPVLEEAFTRVTLA